MSNNLLMLFAFAFALMAMQSIGGLMQIRGYKKAIARVHEHGSVGFGQKRGRFFNGYVVLIACDKNRIITDCEIMDGKTILARFHKTNSLLGREMIGVSIDEFLGEFRMMDNKKQKRYRGYIEALEALELMFDHEAEKKAEQADSGAIDAEYTETQIQTDSEDVEGAQ
ncbi:transcriptional regulator GutM [Faecalicoccus pleomorphus]|jgi:DNA-binding transcriptional regulator of glucitol operon|uniref:transcriptional regulator GutM n=1 Tax=Faecalicoccus pleomorphus TaxID=1323 RepID=UPI0026EC9B9E|nr:transcriptional regulator GutM [Faecalicoccus pleomorphus]